MISNESSVSGRTCDSKNRLYFCIDDDLDSENHLLFQLLCRTD